LLSLLFVAGNVKAHSWKIAGVLGLGLVALVLTSIWHQPREPVSQGKPLSYWVQHRSRSVSDQIAQAALRQIGGEAVPFLIGKLRRGEPTYQRLYLALVRSLPDRLREFLPEPPWLWPGEIFNALTALGPSAIPAMCEAAADPNPLVQSTLTSAIRVNASRANVTVVSAMVGFLSHTNAQVRSAAATVLGQMREQASLRTESVIAGLSKQLSDSDSLARQEAAYALWRINGDTNTISVLLDELKNASDVPTGTKILFYFQAMGRVVKPMIPVISNAVQDSAFVRRLTNEVSRLDRELP
jgi:hypothetical protein